MGIDGIFLYALKKEISALCLNARIDKIHQPSKEELVLLMRSASCNRRLLISVRPSSHRIAFTNQAFENPAEPPMFCMLLRKYLSGAKFSLIEDTGFERIVAFVFDSVNEMGDSIKVKLIVEFIGNQTNIILVGNDGRIIDAIRRSDLEGNSRLIQPGAVYVYPEKQLKNSILDVEIKDLAMKVASCSMPVCKALVWIIDGFSPLVARDVVVRAGIDTEKRSDELDEAEVVKLQKALLEVKNHVLSPLPTALIDANGVPFEFSYMDIVQYGNSAENKHFNNLCELLETVNSERDQRERIKSFANDLVKLVSNIHTRVLKKIAVRENELKRCKDSEKYRIYGELLKANLYRIDSGVPFVEVENYYDSNLNTIRIPLNSALSPAQNAGRYFKEYKKYCNAAAVLDKLIEESYSELKYIESVADELSRVTSVADLNEIKLELAAQGYFKNCINNRKNKIKLSKPIETVSPDGFKVLIGRNNRQNDELTLKIAEKNDIWFHTKNIPGSHVIVVSEGREITQETIMFAAKLAAQHSKAADSSSVPVDYTKIKYVKKPVGAKPGMVIYKSNHTVYVTPERGAL